MTPPHQKRNINAATTWWKLPRLLVDVGEERKLKKARRADRKSPSTVVDRVVEHDLHHDGDNDEEYSDVTIDMSENGNVNIDI
jgi:hypothetical protein